MVAPLIAAFEAAIRVKSFPVIPSKTSLQAHQYLPRDLGIFTYIFLVEDSSIWLW